MNSIYIIVSDFNDTITTALLDGAVRQFKKQGISIPDSHILHVPGALELPITAQKIAEAKKPDAILALGAVIKGNTDHYYYVSQQSIRGIMEVMLKTGTPIMNGILTTENHSQAKARAGSSLETNKGMQVAEGAVKLLEELGKIQ